MCFLGAGIALYPGKAKLLSCKHHYHDYIPPLVDPGKPQKGDCKTREVTYIGPFTNETKVSHENAHRHEYILLIIILTLNFVLTEDRSGGQRSV